MTSSLLEGEVGSDEWCYSIVQQPEKQRG